MSSVFKKHIEPNEIIELMMSYAVQEAVLWATLPEHKKTHLTADTKRYKESYDFIFSERLDDFFNSMFLYIDCRHFRNKVIKCITERENKKHNHL